MSLLHCLRTWLVHGAFYCDFSFYFRRLCSPFYYFSLPSSSLLGFIVVVVVVCLPLKHCVSFSVALCLSVCQFIWAPQNWETPPPPQPKL